MRKLSIIVASILVALMSCTKSKEVHPEIGDGNDEIVTVGMKDVHVEYTRTDHAELNRVVFHYCPADANGNAQQFEAAEMTKKEPFFELTLNNLLSDTLYWYYYELFPNNGDAFTTAQKTFHTQAYDTPEPPEPPTPPSGTPEGAINGLFTINENGDQVYFSQGNLQYQASTNKWRFAEHQWNFVGGISWLNNGEEYGNVYENGRKCDNTYLSSTYDGWIDLFGWGTSGYDHGAVCYQPWSHSLQESDFFVYGIENYNLSDSTGYADWGYNAISNGGNVINYWRTLAIDEWVYVLEIRNTVSGIRYAKAFLNDLCGLLLLPDNWDSSCFNLNNVNQENGPFTNSISLSDWENILEPNGAVFLPITGHRRYGSFYIDTNAGGYWSSSAKYNSGGFTPMAYLMYFQYQSVGETFGERSYGQSVRLVQDAYK